MPDTKKYDRILDALHQLLEDETIQNISVSDIAKKAESAREASTTISFQGSDPRRTDQTKL